MCGVLTHTVLSSGPQEPPPTRPPQSCWPTSGCGRPPACRPSRTSLSSVRALMDAGVASGLWLRVQCCAGALLTFHWAPSSPLPFLGAATAPGCTRARRRVAGRGPCSQCALCCALQLPFMLCKFLLLLFVSFWSWGLSPGPSCRAASPALCSILHFETGPLGHCAGQLKLRPVTLLSRPPGVLGFTVPDELAGSGSPAAAVPSGALGVRVQAC